MDLIKKASIQSNMKVKEHKTVTSGETRKQQQAKTRKTKNRSTTRTTKKVKSTLWYPRPSQAVNGCQSLLQVCAQSTNLIIWSITQEVNGAFELLDSISRKVLTRIFVCRKPCKEHMNNFSNDRARCKSM